MPLSDSINIITEMEVDSLKNSISKMSEPTIIVIKDTIINNLGTGTSIYKPSEINQIDLNISAWLIIIFLGLGIGLYFLLSFLKKNILPVFVQRHKKSNIPLFWYRFSVILWMLFGLLSLYVFLKSSVLITCLIISFFGLVFHQFIIDFVIGIYFQFENHLKLKDRFKLKDVEGEVQSFYSRHIKVLTTKDEETLIPYRNLLRTPIRIVKKVDSLTQKQFEIAIEGDIAENLQILQKYMVMCPWVYGSSSYQINHTKDDLYLVSIKVKKDFTALKVESYIRSKIK